MEAGIVEKYTEVGFDATEDWLVEDFYNFFHQLNILYNRLFVIQEIVDSGKQKKLKNALSSSLSSVKDGHQLAIKSIEIHSPGEFSLLGVDKIIFQLRELFKDAMFRNSHEKEASNESIRHQKIMNTMQEQAGMQKLLQNQINLMKSAGYDQDEILVGIKALSAPLTQLIQISLEKSVVIKEN